MIFVDAGNMPFRTTESKTLIDCPSCHWIDEDGSDMNYVKPPHKDSDNIKSVKDGWNVYIIS